MGEARNIVLLASMLLVAGCSTCTIWDECEPGDVRPCDPNISCGHCDFYEKVCQDNHQWGTCRCVDSGYPWDAYDTWDHGFDTAFDTQDEDWPFDPIDDELGDLAPDDPELDVEVGDPAVEDDLDIEDIDGEILDVDRIEEVDGE
jgi:hypothetical protein